MNTRRARKGRDKAAFTPEAVQKTCDEWNARHPTGTPVRYWEVLPFGPIFDTTTRGAAFVAASGDPVVMLTGKSGFVSIWHIVAAADLHPEAEPQYAHLP